MKSGSSDRCKSKFNHLRCSRKAGHDFDHQAATGNGTTFWTTAAQTHEAKTRPETV